MNQLKQIGTTDGNSIIWAKNRFTNRKNFGHSFVDNFTYIKPIITYQHNQIDLYDFSTCIEKKLPDHLEELAWEGRQC